MNEKAIKLCEELLTLLKSDDSSPWYTVARGEIGVKEITGSEHNDRILQYHATTSYGAKTDEVPWCSSFVNWVFLETNKVYNTSYPITKSAAARSWLDWGIKLDEPKIGCVVIFRRGNSSWQGHVGFYSGETESYIEVLGGNQSNQVKVSKYPKNKLLGYRWPL